MDIAQFNNLLKEKISSAKRFEKRSEWESAINRWLEISEMILNTSKRSDIEFTFRSMLIKKTEQIIEHVKELKAKTLPTPISHHKPEIDIQEEPVGIEEIGDLLKGEEEILKPPIKETEFQPEKIDSKDTFDDSDLKQMPTGFKEISTPKDFKILTPHDEDHIKNLIAKSEESTFSKPQKKEVEDSGRPSEDFKIELDKATEKGEIICFACGQENPPGSKVCKNCGTEL